MSDSVSLGAIASIVGQLCKSSIVSVLTLALAM